MDNEIKIDVLDKGFVRYIDHLGTDKRIVETARVCYSSPSKGDEQDKKLLRYLWINRHTSPFESCNITFNIKMPIFVMRQFVRHRTFRLNEVSARYTEMSDDFYIPTTWRRQSDKNKQASDGEFDSLANTQLTDISKSITTDSYNIYKSLLKCGVAREMARIILPVNLYTEIYVNCDIHNLLHFLELRLHSHAQFEIRQYALAMLKITENFFPWTIDIFRSNINFDLEQPNS